MRVLLVEDDPLLRGLTARVLRAAGHHVTEAGDAHDARRALMPPAAPVDVLLADVRLGGSFDGIAVAEQGLAEYPDLRVILTSGDPGNFPAWHGWGARIATLAKPYRKEQLLEAVEGLPPDADRPV